MPTNQRGQETPIQDHSAQEQGSLHGIFALMRPSPRRRVLMIVFLSYLAFGLLFQLFPPLLAVIGRQFQVNHSSASLVMTLFLAPIVLIALPAGVLVGRYRVRRIGLIAFVLELSGTLVSLAAPSFAILLLGPVLIGAVLDLGSATGAFLSVSTITLAGVLAGLTLRDRKPEGSARSRTLRTETFFSSVQHDRQRKQGEQEE